MSRLNSNDYNLGQIYKYLIQGFTAKELMSLMIEQTDFLELREEFESDEVSKSDLADGLLDFADRRELVPELLESLKSINPGKYKLLAPFECK